MVGFGEDMPAVKLLLLAVDVRNDGTHEFLHMLDRGQMGRGFGLLEEEEKGYVAPSFVLQQHLTET